MRYLPETILMRRPVNRILSPVFGKVDRWYIALIFFIPGFCLPGQSLLPSGYQEIGNIRIEHGELIVEYVDNEELEPGHRKGYNGIASLRHRKEDNSIFVPSFAGFNLEHIFGGDSLDQLFEPRLHPMQLYRKDDRTVLLYQSPTPISGIESLTEFTLTEPHYIDVQFSCVVHNPDFFRHGYAGLFWASYIHQPADPKIYFKGTSGEDPTIQWIDAYSSKHGDASTHRHILENSYFYFAENFNAPLASHFSSYRFSAPFYYGRFGEMVFAYFFKTDQVIRFSQSPTGGGPGNPAWDFQFLIPNPFPGTIYSYRARVIYKPFVTAGDVENEYQQWSRKN